MFPDLKALGRKIDELIKESAALKEAVKENTTAMRILTTVMRQQK